MSFRPDEEEQIRVLIERGDIHGVLQAFQARTWPSSNDIMERVGYLMQAYRVAVRQSRDSAMSEVYLMMIDFTVELLVVSQMQAGDAMIRSTTGNMKGDRAVEQLNEVLPTVERLHQHLMELTKSYATTQHTRQLTQNALSRVSEAPRPSEAELAALPRKRTRR